MGGSHLQTARSELDFHIAVFDDTDFPTYQRHDHFAAAQPLVLWVLRVDAHGRIAHDGFRTCRCHNGVVAFLVLVDDVALLNELGLVVEILQSYNIVLQVEQVTVFLLVDHFLIGESREGLGVPVHHAQTAIDVALAVEVDKHLDDTGRALLIHCESGAVPIARGAQPAQLLQDDAAVLVGPLPGVLQKLVARQVMLFDALFGQLSHHLGFGCNRGVVGARHPAGILAFHASVAHQDVLNGIVEHVSHVEHTRHIGRGNDYCVRLATIRLRAEELVVQPILIPLRFDRLRVVLCC